MPIPNNIMEALTDEEQAALQSGKDADLIKKTAPKAADDEEVFEEDDEEELVEEDDEEELVEEDDEQDEDEDDVEENDDVEEVKAKAPEKPKAPANPYDNVSEEELAAADALLQTETSKPAAKTVDKGPASTFVDDVIKEMTDAEIAVLGGEEAARIMVSAMSRVAKPFNDASNSIKSDIENLGKTVNNDRLVAFRENISSTVEDYKEIVDSKAWRVFLAKNNPYTGGRNVDALLAADARLDRTSVLGIFADFKRLYGKPEPENTGKSKTRIPKAMVTPGKVRGGGNTAPNKKYTFDENYIDNLDEKRRKKTISTAEYLAGVQKYEKALLGGKVRLNS